MVGRVVVLRALKLGDFLVAVPALRAIRRAWPGNEIVLATHGWLRPIVELAACVDGVLATHGLEWLPRWVALPEVAVNLHGAGPRSTEVLSALRPQRRVGHAGHGWSGPSWIPELPERERWCRLLRAHGVPADAADLHLARPEVPSPAPGAVVIHPGAAYRSKRWPVERFAAVARTLPDVVVTGTAAERDLTSQVPGKVLETGLVELAALVASARLIVSGDTGIAHLAYAYRTPSVTLFGPAPARWWGPPADGPHRTLSVDTLRRGDPFADSPDPALLGVTVEQVLAAARESLEEES